MGMGPIIWTCLALTVHQAGVQEYFMKDRGFRIPIKLDANRAGELKALILLVSRDKGKVWEQMDRKSPNEREFIYRAPDDGPYWFIVQEEDRAGRTNPDNPERVKPNLAVIVDATRPQIKLTAERLPSGEIRAHWKAVDQYPDIRSLRLDYYTGSRTEGVWTPAGLPTALEGEQKFLCKDTSGEVRVRLRMMDRAGNEGEDVFVLPASATSSAGAAESPAERSAIGLIAPTQSDPSHQPNQLTSRQTMRPTIEAPPREMPAPPPPTSVADSLRESERTRGASAPPQFGNPSASAPAGLPIAVNPAGQTSHPSQNQGSETPIPPPSAPGNSFTEPAPNDASVRIVQKREVRIDFTVGKVGPSGLGNADVYVTLDRGRSWKKMPQELLINPSPSSDGRGPVVSGSVSVQLPAEGIVYGFIVSAKSKAGLAPLPPKPNDPPQALVEWDKTPPTGQLFRPQPDPSQPNTLVLGWEVKDRNLAERPITLEWAERKDGPWHPIGQGALPNTGQHPWHLPEQQLPPRVYLRMTMRDLAGNESQALTDKPELIDLSVPQTKIIGIAPASR